MISVNSSAEVNDIKVSVVMPIYNAYSYIRPALDSVLAQSLEEIELICVDDGSTDGSVGILKAYCEKDSRIKIINQENFGPARARNRGLASAKGEYIAFLDADDFFERDMLESLYAISKRDDLDIAICKYDLYSDKEASFKSNPESAESEIFDTGAVASKNEYPETILQSTSGVAWNKLFKRSFLAEKGIHFLDGVKMYEDVYFTVCALAFAERVGKVQRILAHHRVYGQQTRVKEYKRNYKQVPEVCLRIKEFLMKGGMHQPLHKSFFNFSVGRCFRVFNTIPNDVKDDFWNLVHEKYAEPLGWLDIPVTEIKDEKQKEFLSNILLYNHEQYLARLKKGKESVPAEKVGSELVKVKKREQIKRLFVKLFGIKEKS